MATVESLTQDPERRWQENITEIMEDAEVREFLLDEAHTMEGQEEWECAYHIFREMVWRFPKDAQAWHGLARMASTLDLIDEAAVAAAKAHTLPEK